MIRKIQSYLGLKLFVLLTVVIVLSVLSLTYTALQVINAYGREVASISEKQIRDRVMSSLSGFTLERAARYQAFFDRVAACAGLVASQAAQVYSGLEAYARQPLLDVRYSRQPGNGHWGNTLDDPVISLYWGGPELHADILRELRALTHMTPLLQRVLAENPEVLASHMITVSGIGQYCTDEIRSKEAALALPPASQFDLRDGEPLTIFSGAGQTDRQVRWTGIYKDDVIDGLMLTASAPIHDKEGVFRGITGIDVPLRTVVEEILNDGDTSHVDPIMFSFLVDRGGGVIALPEDYFPFFGLRVDRDQFRNSSDRLNLSLYDSTDQHIRDLARALQGRDQGLYELHHDGQPYYLAASRMPGLGWVFGVVVKESDILAAVERNQLALAETIKRVEFKGSILSVGVILIAVAVIFLAVRHLVTPLRTLATATRRVTEGDLSVRCPVMTTDEAGVLAASFNTMVEQLQIAQQSQARYAEELERMVAKRTQELINKRSELEETVELLRKEAERRQIVDEALRLSRQQYYDTMEASKAGIFIISDGLFTHVNSSFAELFRSEREQLIGTDPLQVVLAQDRPAAARHLQRLGDDTDMLPTNVRCVRSDKSIFHSEIWAKSASWRGKQVVVGTLIDVSDLRRHEERLRLQDHQLQKSLEEKEILLREIYHRTKNNMLVIISMLNLQTMEIQDSQVRTVFQEMEDRIRAMALVHEKLYQSQNLSEIDMGSYVREISQSLVVNMSSDERIELRVDIESMVLNIDYAVPLGLVVNEIVTNSLKHAFPGGRSGIIAIRLRQDEIG
ncbi:MAG: HAMP domain-containing protein, partial [Desulfofustis sp.]|nr:HAMP domain-containing protein [Desulfofustis sp.]